MQTNNPLFELPNATIQRNNPDQPKLPKDWTGNLQSIVGCLGASNHSAGEREMHDFYATDPIAAEWLIQLEELNSNIWECAAGQGHLAKVFENHGFNVKATDLVNRGYGQGGVDFLACEEKFDGDIVTNPPYKCFSSDTECYTKLGWKLLTSLDATDEIMSINPDTLEVEWSPISAITIRPFNPNTEKMYHFKQAHLDIMCTNGHRMFAFSKKHKSLVRKNGDLIHSEDIRSTHYLPKSGFSWKGIECDTFVLPAIDGMRYAQPIHKDDISMNMDAWLRFFGLWLADGYCRHTKNSQGNYRKTVGIKQLAKNKGYVEEVLNSLPFKYSEYYDKNRKNLAINFEIHNEQLWEYLKQFGKSSDKYIPTELKELSSRQLQILLDSYFFGDGSAYGNHGRMYRTISRKLIEDVQEIIFKLGNLTHVVRGDFWKNPEYNIVYNPDSKYTIATFPSNKHDACKVEYSGQVCCVTLAKNGVMLLRRNGIEFICGNCAQEFVEHSLSLVPEGHKVCMFLKVQFLEGKSRKELFLNNPPRRVWVSSSRISCSKNGNNFSEFMIAYAWYVWEKGYHGDTILKWFN